MCVRVDGGELSGESRGLNHILSDFLGLKISPAMVTELDGNLNRSVIFELLDGNQLRQYKHQLLQIQRQDSLPAVVRNSRQSRAALLTAQENPDPNSLPAGRRARENSDSIIHSVLHLDLSERTTGSPSRGVGSRLSPASSIISPSAPLPSLIHSGHRSHSGPVATITTKPSMSPLPVITSNSDARLAALLEQVGT